MSEFKMIPVPSSNIEAVGHVGTKLRVRFKGGATYEYAGVSEDLFAELVTAESVGKFVNAEIKGKYDSRKLEAEEV